jgi:hypothetical protein
MAQLTTTTAAPTVPRNGFGITALVLALIGLVFGLVLFTGFIALILGMLAMRLTCWPGHAPAMRSPPAAGWP